MAPALLSYSYYYQLQRYESEECPFLNAGPDNLNGVV